MFKIHLLFFFLFSLSTLHAQNYWKRDAQTLRTVTDNDDKYLYYSLDKKAFNASLHNRTSRSVSDKKIVQIPNADGKIESFEVTKTKILSDKLAQKYPEIETYSGVSVSNPAKSVNFT